jgi:2-dehydropantoate 2-reductase
VVPEPVRTDPGDVAGPVDIVLLAVKDTQTEGAAGWLAKLCDERTVVCALQNGVEQRERVGRWCPESTVLPAVVWFSAETQQQGWVRLRTPVRLVLPDEPAARRLEVLRGPRLSLDTDPDFVTATWHKLVVNAVAGLMVLTGRKSGMFRRADIATLARRYVAEALTVARAEGAKLGDERIEEIVSLFTEVPEDLTTSILTDREQGRPLEWDVRNGVIARKAAEHGLPTPVSDVLIPLLAAASDGPG